MANNQIIIQSRETGKTTYLLNEIKRFINEGTSVIILDSATEHEDKSLFKKVVNSFNNTVTINITDPDLLNIDKMSILEFASQFKRVFPFKEVLENKDKIICFDLSFFLERGHEVYEKTGNINAYKYYRNLYNMAAEQITLVLILMESHGIIKNTVVIMDEIEFPISDYNISIFQNDLKFLASVHPENNFGTFYQSFEEIKFKVYSKRKE